MGRLHFNDIKRTMKTEPCKGKPGVRPSPALLDRSILSRSEDEKNNNLCNRVSMANGVNNLSAHTGLKKPECEKIVNKQKDTRQNNGNRNVTDDLIDQISNIKLDGEEDNTKKTITKEVKDNNLKHTEPKTANKEKNDEDGEDDDLCSRGPTRSGFLSSQRDQFNPYQIRVTSLNNTTSGGTVFMGPSVIGPAEEAISLDQLFEEFQQFPDQDLSSDHTDEILRQEIAYLTRDAKRKEDLCAYLRKESLGSDYLRSPSPLDNSSLDYPVPNIDNIFPEASPLSFSGASPNQHLPQSSPHQVVPSGTAWQNSSSPYSTSSLNSPLSSATSPSQAPFFVNYASSSLSDNVFYDDLGTDEDRSSSLDGVDFSVPEHPLLNTYIDNLSCSEKSPSAVTTQQPLYTPILCPLSPDQSTSAVSRMSPTGYIQNVPAQPTMSLANNIPIISSSALTQSVQTTNVTTPQTTTSVTNQLSLLSAAGFTQTTLLSNGQSAIVIPLIKVESSQSRQQTINRIIPLIKVEPSQTRRQPVPRVRPQPILPARKDPIVPCMGELLKCMDQQKKKAAWLRVNNKSEDYFTRADEDGDTVLMIAVSQRRDDIYELVYAIVEYVRRYSPEVLSWKNKHHQTALYNACILLPQCPLIARYLAETLLSLRVDIAKDRYEGNLTLVECVQRRGATHSSVLNTLLSLRNAEGKPVFSD